MAAEVEPAFSGFEPTQAVEPIIATPEPVAEPEIPTGFGPVTETVPEPLSFDLIKPERPAASAQDDPPIPDDPPEPSFDADEAPAPEAHPTPDFEPEPEPQFELENEANFEPVHFHPGPPTILDLHEDPPGEARRWPWVLGSVLALLLLAGQLLLQFRTDLIAAAPNTRPVFVTACELLGCTIALPHKIDLMSIESSDLAPDEQVTGMLHLTANLRNRAPYAQAWPRLEVTLTDAHELPLLRRALTAEEYLPAGVAPGGGFPRRSEQPIRLKLSAADVPAVGYRLYIFYP